MKKYLLLAALSLSLSAFATPPCTGKTKSGVACGAMAKKGSAFCFHHDPKAVSCAGKKKDGGACSIKVKTVGAKCHIHS